MGEVIRSEKISDRYGETIARRFFEECRALERDGVLDTRDVLAFARTHPQSAIRTMLIDPPDADDGSLLNTLRIEWVRALASRR